MVIVCFKSLNQLLLKYLFYHNYVNSMPNQMLAANVRVYDHLRCQSDSVSRYTNIKQNDTACSLMPSN